MRVPVLPGLLAGLAVLLPLSAEAQRTATEVPYVPTPPAVVAAMLEAAGVGPDDVVYDLGSGDGRIVIAAARDFGARGVGVEIDAELVELARANARRVGVADRVEILERDLFLTDLRDATVVTLYLLPIINYRLQPKLLSELRPGARIVAHAYDMSEWPPDREFQVEGRWVFYWVVPARVEGEWRWESEGSATRLATLRQRFQRVSGSVRGGSGEAAIEDAVLNGREISFVTRTLEDGVEVTRRYSGCVEGDRIVGNVEIDGGAHAGRLRWEAVRSGRAP